MRTERRIFILFLGIAISSLGVAGPAQRDTQRWTYNDKILTAIRREVDSRYSLHLTKVSDKEANIRLTDAWSKYVSNNNITSAYRFIYLCCQFRKASTGYRKEIQQVFNSYSEVPSYEWERVRSSTEAFQPYFDRQASKAIILRLLKREPNDTLNMDAYIAIAPLLTPSELDQAMQMIVKLTARYPKATNFYREMEAYVLFSKADQSLSRSDYDKAIAAYEKLRDDGVIPKKQAEIAISSLKHAVEWVKSKGKLKP